MKPTNTRAALYARVSTTEGKQHLDNQLRELRSYARRMGWQIFGREYTDQITGTSTSRPGLDRLMADAATRKFDTVLVFDLSRLTRNGPASAFALIERLKTNGVDMWSLKEEYFRTSGPAGAVLIAIAAFLAKQERDMLRARVQAGIARAKAAGTRLGRPPQVVDRLKLLALREQGLSIRTIAARLECDKNTVLRILKESQP